MSLQNGKHATNYRMAGCGIFMVLGNEKTGSMLVIKKFCGTSFFAALTQTYSHTLTALCSFLAFPLSIHGSLLLQAHGHI